MNRVPTHRHLLFWFLVCAVCGWDLYSKATVFERLGAPNGASDWTQTFFGGGVTFRYWTTFNHGALWGVGQGLSFVFAGLSLLAVGVILYWLFVRRHAHSAWLTVSLAFIMGGTLGNLWDRLGMHGYQNAQNEIEYAVRDFLFFTLWGYHWPVFNYADVFLVTGAVMLGLHSLFVAEPEAENAKQASVAQSEAPSVS